MNEKHCIKSSCFGLTNGKQCLNLIGNTTRYCSNCGTPNPDFCTALSTEEYDDQSSSESSCSEESDDEDHTDKWNADEQCDTTSVLDVLSINDYDDQSFGEISSGNTSDDGDQNDKWNPVEQRETSSDGEKVTDSDECKIDEEHGMEYTSAGEQITDTDEVKECEDNIIESTSAGAETLDDEIPMDIGLGSIKNEVLKMLQTGGPKAVVEYLQMTTASWKSATVKIAVAGKSKAGKSSFINAIRGVDHTDEAFAKEGRGEKSLDVQEYRHTKNKRIIYCDLPGYGNISMTRKTFLEKVQLLEYDIFLIFVYPVPSEDDAWLVAQLMEADRGFCFVRAKIDQDMKNAPKMGKTEKDVLVEIREKVSSAVKVMPAIEDVELFLISKKNLSIGEMDELIAFIEMKIPKLKFEAVLLTLTAFSNQVIEKKYQFFKDRISSLSLAIALDGDPIKYHGYFLAYSEIMMYFEAFELNAIFDPEIPNLTHPFSESCIYKLLDSLREKVPGVFKQIVPIYNWVATYRVCKRFFTQLLDELKMDYCKMMKFFKKQRENIGISPDGDICPSDCPCVKIKQITF